MHLEDLTPKAFMRAHSIRIQRTNSTQLGKGSRLALIGAFVNIVMAAVKIATGIIGNSYALIADGIESTLDIFSSILVWVGLRFAALPPDQQHPYGHGRAETLATIAVGLLIILTAVLLGIHSVQDILAPHHHPAPFTLFILVGVVVVKEFLYRKFQTLSSELGSSALESDAWHHRSDALTSAAAALGIAITWIGGERWRSADGIAALAACSVILINGIRILGPALNEAMDTAPPPQVEGSVRTAALKVMGVRGIEKCRIRKLGIVYYVDLHVQVDGHLSVRDGHAIAHAVKDTVCAGLPAIADVLVHIEPA